MNALSSTTRAVAKAAVFGIPKSTGLHRVPECESRQRNPTMGRFYRFTEILLLPGQCRRIGRIETSIPIHGFPRIYAVKHQHSMDMGIIRGRLNQGTMFTHCSRSVGTLLTHCHRIISLVVARNRHNITAYSTIFSAHCLRTCCAMLTCFAKIHRSQH